MRPDLNLPETTIRCFKKSYCEELKKNFDVHPAVEITVKPKCRPPLLLDLDKKFITFLKAIRAKVGVVNIHVVRAAADALIASNPSSSIHLWNFSK